MRSGARSVCDICKLPSSLASSSARPCSMAICPVNSDSAGMAGVAARTTPMPTRAGCGWCLSFLLEKGEGAESVAER